MEHPFAAEGEAERGADAFARRPERERSGGHQRERPEPRRPDAGRVQRDQCDRRDRQQPGRPPPRRVRRQQRRLLRPFEKGSQLRLTHFARAPAVTRDRVPHIVERHQLSHRGLPFPRFRGHGRRQQPALEDPGARRRSDRAEQLRDPRLPEDVEVARVRMAREVR